MVPNKNNTLEGKANMNSVDTTDVWAQLNKKRPIVKPMTVTWLGRCMAAMARELGRDPGERTRHAIKPRTEELFHMGVKSEHAGKILAYEYQNHSRLEKTIQEQSGEIARLRQLLGPGATGGGARFEHRKAPRSEQPSAAEDRETQEDFGFRPTREQ